MQVHALLLADSAQEVNGKLYMLGGAWSVLNVGGGFPTTHMIGIGVALDIGWNETNQRFHVEITVEDADGGTFPEPRIEVDFEAGRPPGHPIGADQRVVFAVNGPFAIPQAGAYSIVLRCDGEELARSRFMAVAKAG